MRKYIFICLFAQLLFSCSKDNKKPDGTDGNTTKPVSVFSVSLNSTNNIDVTNFTLNGSLQVTSTSEDIEYGFIFSSYPDPSIYQGKVIGIGKSQKSLNYTYTIANLDTGKTYYCRAYALLNGTAEYSPVSFAGKVTPYIVDVQTNSTDTTANPTIITVETNFMNLAVTNQVNILMDNKSYSIISTQTVGTGTNFTISYPGKLAAGAHSFIVKLGNINLSFKKYITLPAGKWTKLPIAMSYSQSLVYTQTAGFIKDNWIYSYRLYPQEYPAVTYTKFFKQNIYTGQVVQLSLYDKTAHFIYAPAIVISGNQVHFIGGEEYDLYATACVNSHYVYNTDTDTWTKEQDFPGAVRRNAVTMVYNNKIYYGMGFNTPNYNNSASAETERTDMWTYDLQTKTWLQQLAGFPDGGRMHNTYFSIGSKIFLVCGYDRFSAEQTTWCYDAQSNSWSRKADFPGPGFEDAASFQLNQYGYVGLGTEGPFDSYTGPVVSTNFFRYDPVADKWTQIGDLQYLSQFPFSGVSNNYGIIAGGYVGTDIYKYTP